VRRSRFAEERVIGVLEEHEAGVAVAEVCRRHGMSSASSCAWRTEFGGMWGSGAKRLPALEGANARLKRLLADATLESLEGGRDRPGDGLAEGRA
jgi:putative transposase